MRHKKPRGFLTNEEAGWLEDIAKYRPYVLEFGSWCGLSAWHLSVNAQKVWCVDAWNKDHIGRWAGCNTENAMKTDAEVEFYAALGHEIAMGVVVPIKVDLRSEGAEARIREELDGDKASMVFIDAGHEAPHPDLDIQLAMQFVSPLGIIAGHDYGRQEWPAVKEAVDRRFQKVQRGPHTIWWANAEEYIWDG